MRSKINNSQGIGLVETILALGISVVVITALVSLAVYTLRSSQQSKFLLEGSKLASEQVELLRLEKDKMLWDDFTLLISACASSPCHVDLGAGVTSGEETVTLLASTPPIVVQRYFTLISSDTDVVRVSSVVEWEFGGDSKKTSIVTDISNWRN